MSITMQPIGHVVAKDGEFHLVLQPEYAPALRGLEGFSHVQALWWFDGCDNADCRAQLTEDKPYTHGPDVLGAFATRSPNRPNPIALSCAAVIDIDVAGASIGLAYIDADDGSPLLDIKPYTPSLDRVSQPEVPAWCAHWPKDQESSEDFDWGSEFNF